MKDKPVQIYLLPITLTTILGWTCLVAALLWLNWQWVGENIVEIARVEARASINKDILYRTWNAKHGGVYVPITADTQPNPYLNVPQRDVTATDGLELTLINPAYMMRQVNELEEKTDIRVRLTSLKPLNPKNAPDAWERKALQSFEAGATEADALDTIDGQEYLRIMLPFVVKEECLKCHAMQGYQIGDIRGGISAATPLALYAEIKESYARIVYFGYSVIWLTGLVGIALTSKELKRRLKREEKQSAIYRSILQTSMEGFWQVHASGRLVDVNPAYCAMSGYTREELLQMKTSDLEVIEEETRSHFQQIMETGSDQFESIHRRKDGTRYAVEINVSKLDDENVESFIRDITEKKKAEEKLRESEATLKEAQHMAQIGNWTLNLQDQTLFWSDEIYRIFDVEPQSFEANYNAFLNAIHPEDRERVNAAYQDSVSNHTAYQITHRLLMKDGRVKFVIENGQTFYDENGNATKSVGTVQDITERKKSEDALLEKESMYRALFNEMLDAFALHELICDESGQPVDYRFLAVNPVFETMTGLEAKNIIGKTVLEVLPNTEKFWIERYGKVALTGKPDHFEEFSASLNRYYEVHAFRPAPMQFAVIFHDVSERKFTENITLSRMKIVEIATQQSLDALLQTILEEAEKLTGSSIGFYHFVSEDQKSLTLQNWSTRTLKEFCHATGKGMHYPIEQAGVWVECVRKKKPVIHNDYPALPPEQRKGLPEGHAELKRELTVPVIHSGKVVAILGVGNKPSEYTRKDTDVVQQLADMATEIVERKRAEEALRENQVLLRQAQKVAQLGYYQLNALTGVWESSDILDGIFGIEPNHPKTVEGWLEIIHPEDRERMSAYFAEEVLKLKQGFNMEYRIVRKNDGETRWVHGLGKLYFDESGNVTRMVGTIQDITQRKKDELDIVEKSNELEALFKISSSLRAAQNAQDMLPLALQEITNVFHSDANAIVLLDAERRNFIYTLGNGNLARNTGKTFPAQGSISGLVMQTLQPYISEDFSNDPRRTNSLVGEESLGAAILAPLQSEKEFIGTLLCARKKDSQQKNFTASEVSLLQAIGEMLGNALRRANLFEDALLRLERMQALRAIDAAINASMDASLTLRVLVSETVSLLKVEAAAALLYNPATQMLEQIAAQGITENAHRNLLRGNNGYAQQIITEQRGIYIPNLPAVEDPFYANLAKTQGFDSAYLTPMVSKGQVCGILEVYQRETKTRDQEWQDFLKALSGQAAIAVNNAQLFANLEKSNTELSMAYEATIEGWSRALELRDRETEGHTLRVTNYAVKFAELAGLNSAEILRLKHGALLHDIGKMGVPDNILNKAGALTPAEWDIMRQHPQHAYNMLAPIAFLRPSIDIPYCHHEKWDGSGYPRGLQGEQIPLAARLFAIIDVWDALTSTRPYRQAWNAERTSLYIREQIGKHFDPQLAELFLANVDKFQKIEGEVS